MRFNAFVWKNYLESAAGRKQVAFFSDLGERYAKSDRTLKDFIVKWAREGLLQEIPSADEDIDVVLEAMEDLRQATSQDLLPTKSIKTWTEAEEYFRDGIGRLNVTLDDDPAEEISLFTASSIPALSVALYCKHPKWFFPYYFFPRFYLLKQICEEFGVFLPPIPPKQDSEARFCYYLELCKSLLTFCGQNEIEPEHIAVFLYGFAPQVVPVVMPLLTALPQPHRAWFVGGGANNNGDFQYLDDVKTDSRTFWQGNVETVPGDIVVMYCLTPRSHVHSIWRAIQPGAIEPFRNYYNTIWIGYPQLVTPLSINEIKADSVLSQLPLVRGNMQGINGRRIPKVYYDRLLTLLAAKGCNVSSLPQLEDVEAPGIILKTESDVEKKLLEPLLRDLGFTEKDWIRQLKLRVGTKDKVIPDYVIFPRKNTSAHSSSGSWVWEAKLSVATNQQLEKDFVQASSYAKLVGAAGVSLISREGIWIGLKEHDYELAHARHWSMAQSRQSDERDQIRQLAGERAMRRGKLP